MTEPHARRPLGYIAAAAIGFGIVGMVVSFHFLSLADARDIAAGNAGFISGAILIGSGLISLAILARRD